jgi:hypothetical protein
MKSNKASEQETPAHTCMKINNTPAPIKPPEITCGIQVMFGFEVQANLTTPSH